MAGDVWERAVMAGLNTFSDAIPGNIRYREQICGLYNTYSTEDTVMLYKAILDIDHRDVGGGGSHNSYSTEETVYYKRGDVILDIEYTDVHSITLIIQFSVLYI